MEEATAVSQVSSRERDVRLLREIQGYAHRIGEASAQADFGDMQVAIATRYLELSDMTKKMLRKVKPRTFTKSVADCITTLTGRGTCNNQDGMAAAIGIKYFLQDEDEEKAQPSAAASSSARTPLLEESKKKKCCCFLTSACVTARNLPDDCEELTILRDFRDGYVQALPEGEEIIAEYYRVAPGIVAGIEQRQNAQSIFSGLYQDLVIRCVELIQGGRHEEALDVYGAWVRRLSAEYSAESSGCLL